MPGKRVLPIVACNSRATTLKGLGGIDRLSCPPPGGKAKKSSAGSLAQEHEKG